MSPSSQAPRASPADTLTYGICPDEQTEDNISKIPKILPHERVFPIQIGTELFKLSGASISSDAPSYFSQCFRCQMVRAEENGEDPSTAVRTLYIDRDPATFRDIAHHLQGYYVKPRDSTHYVRLFADAQFYNLPKLMSQLYEEPIFVSIGGREFVVPRNLFIEPGNSPNYFTLSFGFFTAAEKLFPGLKREDLVRPPSIQPSAIPNRSAQTFSEILQLLRGYPVEPRSEEHRQALLLDCKYYLFKGLEQRLIPHSRAYNQARDRHEICLRLSDVLKSGISVVTDVHSTPTPSGGHTPDPLSGWVHYARPYVDAHAAELILETRAESARLHFYAGGVIRVEFFGDTRARIGRLFEVIATKLNLSPTSQPLGLLMAMGGADSQPPTPGNTSLSDNDHVRVAFVPETAVTLDGRPLRWDADDGFKTEPLLEPNGRDDSPASTPGVSLTGSRKRRRTETSFGGHAAGGMSGEEWAIGRAQWRLRVQGSKNGRNPTECVLVAVKIEATSSEQARNALRGFLG